MNLSKYIDEIIKGLSTKGSLLFTYMCIISKIRQNAAECDNGKCDNIYLGTECLGTECLDTECLGTECLGTDCDDMVSNDEYNNIYYSTKYDGIDVNAEYDGSRVIIQKHMATVRPYAEIIENTKFGKVQVYKSVIILTEGIVITLFPNYKIRISQEELEYYDLMLMDSTNTFIDLNLKEYPEYYSKLIPKKINISNLQEEIYFLLLVLPTIF
jgi:hypothetical protein